MCEKVKKLGIKREGKFLFIKNGDVWQLRPKKKVRSVGLKRMPGYLYFVDKDGDISKTKQKRK